MSERVAAQVDGLVVSELLWSSGDLLLRGSDAAQSVRMVRLEQIVECSLQLPLGGGESVAVHRMHPLLWNYGAHATIFGNAPLPDPPRFFQEFYKLVVCDLGLPRDPARYLNWGESLSEWFGFVYSRSYRLLTAPVQVVEAARSLLDVQAADYTVLSDPPLEGAEESLTAVTIGRSWAVCSAIHEQPSASA